MIYIAFFTGMATTGFIGFVWVTFQLKPGKQHIVDQSKVNEALLDYWDKSLKNQNRQCKTLESILAVMIADDEDEG